MCLAMWSDKHFLEKVQVSWEVGALLTKSLMPFYQIVGNEAVCAVGGFKLHRILPCWVSAEVIF